MFEHGDAFDDGASPGRPGDLPSGSDRHVPGSSVGPLDPQHVLRCLVNEIFRCPHLGSFAKRCLRQAKPENPSGGPTSRPSDGAWPMPLPYPGVFKKDAAKLCKDELKKLVVNAFVILLNYLDLGKVSRSRASCHVGVPLNSKQWEAVRRFECFLDA